MNSNFDNIIKANKVGTVFRSATSAIGLTLALISLTSMLTGCSTVAFLEQDRMPSPVGMVGMTGAITEIAPQEDKQRTGVSANEIKIGSCCALSGAASLLGANQLMGASSYLNYINDQGGVNGRKIKLVAHDDAYDPNKAIVCFKQLVKEGAFAGAFFVGTPPAARYVPMAEAYAIPILGLYTGAQLLHSPLRAHILNVRASYSDETKSQVDNLWAVNHRKIAVIYPSDAFGASVLNGVKLALQRHKATPIALGSYARNTLNIDDAINQVRMAKPDAVIMAGPYSTVAQIVKRSHQKNWKPIFTTVSFLGTEAFIKAAGKDAEGTIVTQVLPPYNRDDLPTAVLYRRLLQTYYPNRQPTFSGFEGFVDAMVLVQGLKNAGKDLTRSGFIKAIESMKNTDMGLGNLKLSYNSRRHVGFDTVYPTVVRQGQAVTLTDWKHL